MVKRLRTVQTAVFIYDCSRLIFLLMLLVSYLKQEADPVLFRGLPLPYMMYTAPNALFPLMALFLFLNFDTFRVYVPLYITGKSLSLLCMLIWLFFALQQFVFTAGGFSGQILLGALSRVLWAVFLCAADIGTIMGMLVMREEALPVLPVEAGLNTGGGE
ncbi:hypothetical protein AGMMS50230_07250 [Spirochaetia bacterium]|nr:hypothetical protein AGMMS50230_07250 [Spirochaetia bacterium]